jgi:hypothetical protein
MRLATVGTKRVDDRDVEVYGDPQPYGPCGPACPDFVSRRCKPHAKLRVILATQQSVGGCYEFATTSWNSLRNLTESLEMIRAVTRGPLAWVPLVFSLSPQTVQPRDGGRANTAYIARVTFPGSPRELLGAVRDTMALQAPILGQIRALEASLQGGAVATWEETPEDVEAFQREYVAGDLVPEPGEGDPDPSARTHPVELGLGGNVAVADAGPPPADDTETCPDPEQPAAPPEATSDATPDQLAQLSAASADRAEALFEQAATADARCSFASVADLDRAMKRAALQAFGLRGKHLPSAAVAPLVAFFNGCTLGEDGGLVAPVSDGPF